MVLEFALSGEDPDFVMIVLHVEVCCMIESGLLRASSESHGCGFELPGPIVLCVGKPHFDAILIQIVAYGCFRSITGLKA